MREEAEARIERGGRAKRADSNAALTAENRIDLCQTTPPRRGSLHLSLEGVFFVRAEAFRRITGSVAPFARWAPNLLVTSANA